MLWGTFEGAALKPEVRRATAPQLTKDGKSIFFPLCKKVDSHSIQIYAVKLDAFAR